MDLTELKVTRYEVADAIATITLHRPDRLNAWTGRMHTEYRSLLARAADDPGARVIVVTGSGRGFCVGADTRALEGHVERGSYDAGVADDVARPGYGVRPEFDADFAYQFGIPKPIIAAINGPAAGVGLVLACYCDLRFAAAGVKLTTSHGRLGLPAEYGLSWLLPRLIGLTRAADILLSSRVVLAEEAERLGLVNRVVAPAELMETTYAYARLLATEIAPSSLAATKLQLYSDLHGDVGSSVTDASSRLADMMQGPDFAEGVAALTEKRPPHFLDRAVVAHVPPVNEVITPIRERLRDGLTQAMKERDQPVVSVLRIALAAIDNAAAIDEGAEHAAHAVEGAEVERAPLSEEDIRGIIGSERDELLAVAEEMGHLAAPEKAEELRAQAALLSTYLEV